MFTPDEVRSAQPSVDCKFCKLRVLIKRPPPTPLVLAPLAWPEGFELTEHDAPTPTPTPMAITTTEAGGDPYRTAPRAAEVSLMQRAGLTIGWRQQRMSTAIVLGLMMMWFAATVVIALHNAVILFFSPTGLIATLALMAGSVNRVRVHADHEALSVRSGPIPIKRSLRLAVDDIAQLFTLHAIDGGTSTYRLHARDRSGRDHLVVTLDTPEQAWWLEERLERHLGIADRLIEGEHRRKQLTDGQPGGAGTTQT